MNVTWFNHQSSDFTSNLGLWTSTPNKGMYQPVGKDRPDNRTMTGEEPAIVHFVVALWLLLGLHKLERRLKSLTSCGKHIRRLKTYDFTIPALQDV